MELKEFVKETILQITDGVLEASSICKEKGVMVNPLMKGGEGMAFTQTNDTASIIKFKVILCKSDDTSTQNGIGVFLANFGVGTTEKGCLQNSSMTSLEFSLPVEFPHVMYVEGNNM